MGDRRRSTGCRPRRVRAGRARRTPRPGRAARRRPCCGRRSAPARPATCGPRSRCASGSGGTPGRCRRAASPGRRRRHPHVVAQQVGVLGLDVAGAVLEPEQVARGRLRARRRRRAAEAELRPADRDPAEADADQVADGVHGDLRVVRAGLDADVAVAARRVQVVRRETRQVDQRAPAAASASPNRSSNSDGPKPIVSVSADAGRSSASPVSLGGASALPPTAPFSAGLLARRHPLGGDASTP